MGKRKNDAIWVAVLTAISCFIIWHVFHWHYIGMYLKMFDWIGTDSTYIVVLYNLGLMLGVGFVLGFLMKKITDLVGYEVRETKHFEEEEGGNSK